MSPSLRLLLSGGLGFALMGAIPGLYGLALPYWAAAFGAGGEGWLLSVHGLGAAATVVGGLFGLPFLTMRLGLVLMGLGAAGLGLGPGWAAVLAAALVTGAGYGLLSLVINRRFLTEFGPRGPGMVGLVNAIFGVGAILAPQAFVLAGARPGPVFFGLALMFLATVPLVRPSGRTAAATGLPELHRGRLTLLGFVFLAITLEVGLFGYGPTALLATGLGTATVATLTSGFFATFLSARLALYWLTRTAAPERLFLWGFAGVAAAMVVAATVAPAAGFVLAGAAVGVQFPSFYVWAIRVLGPDPRLSSAPLVGSLTGATAGPLLLAPLLAAWGPGALFPACAAIAAIGGLALGLSLPRFARIAAA